LFFVSCYKDNPKRFEINVNNRLAFEKDKNQSKNKFFHSLFPKINSNFSSALYVCVLGQNINLI